MCMLTAGWMLCKVSCRCGKFIANHISGNHFSYFMWTILQRDEYFVKFYDLRVLTQKNFQLNSKYTSCTACPHRAKTCNWNLPCICPTVSVLSNPSMLANRSNFGTRRFRNFSLRFSNHPLQYCSDFDKSILHVYFFSFECD